MANLKQQKLFTAIVAIGLLLVSLRTHATHIMGANITYECAGPGRYLVYLTMYRDCKGIDAETSHTLNYRSVQCGVNSSITLSRIAGPTDVTPIAQNCGVVSSCASSSGQYGVQKIVYRGTLNLPVGCGNDWVLWWDLCCRNNAINTLNNPGNQSTYIETRLNNTLTPCNNSPVFLNDPVAFYCINQTAIYNHGVTDVDGDSLVFSLIAPRDANGVQVTYVSPYSPTNPIATSGGFNINAANGDITFTPTQAQTGVTAVLVQEYRNGVLIGSVVRDMQLIVLNCNNNLPTSSGMNGTNKYVDTICAGSTISFTVNSADLDANQVVTMTWNNAIVGASFTISSGSRPVGTFTWTPPLNTPSGNYIFTVKVEDNACPLRGSNTYSYTIFVKPNPNPPVVGGGNRTICEGQSVTLTATTQATNGVSYTWSDGVTTYQGNSITVTPLTTTVYTVSLTYTDGCISTDNVLVKVNDKPTAVVFPPSATICSGGSVQLTASSPTATGFIWSPATGLSCTNCPNPIASPTTTTTYQVTPVDAANCPGDPVAVTVTTATAPPAASCEVIYVTTNGTGDGTQQNPTNLGDALARARCNNSWIKMAVGTYGLDTAITNISSYTTLEGGYDPVTWTKSSQPGLTRIFRGINNIEGIQQNAPRLVAIYLNSVSYVRFQDLTIEVANAPLTSTYGVSTYGIHMTNCSNYDFVRTQIIAGNASAGANGTNGTNGANGANGGNANGRNGGIGACGVSGCGGNGGTGGVGAFLGGSNGTAGAPGQNGGGAGGAGGGGGFTCQQIGLISGSSSRPGSSGANGANGTNGANGSAGSLVGGFFVPGSQGGNGSNGGNGLPGGGGGGAGGATFGTNGGGGGGGGAGGAGGSGGTGGYGGGSSIGVYLYNNGIAGNFVQANIVSGNFGAGGTGGIGGSGGNGGSGGLGFNDGTFGLCDNSPNGDGGAGGRGGNGGNGGNGSPGFSRRVVFDGGAPLTSNDTVFNLAAQAVINATNVSCTNTQITLNEQQSQPGSWNFGAGASPQTANISPSTIIYTNTGRKNITYGNNFYAGFVNIAISQASYVPNILTTANPFAPDSFFLCAGQSATFQAQINGATSYDWDFGGAVNPNTYTGSQYQTLTNLVFSTPGTYEIRVRIFSDCCGFSPYARIYLRVDPQPSLTLTGPNFLCTGSDVTLTASGANSYTWTPAFGLSSTTGSTVVAAPSTSITYTVIGTAANGLCRAVDSIRLNVAPTPTITFNTVDAVCGNDGAITAIPSPPGNYNYQWNDPLNSQTAGLTNVLPGVYTVTVTDAVSGCSATKSGFVSPGPNSLVAFVDSSKGVSCFGACNGFARVRTINGVGPFTYLWSNGATGVSASNLCAGNYSVTVTGSNQCFAVATVTITQNDTLRAEIRAKGDNICWYDNKGYAWANGVGGLGPFIYTWNDPLAQDSNWAINLANGTYTVTVQDRNGCTATTSVTITSPDSIRLNAAISQITCHNANNGTIVIQPSGGQPQLTVQWTPSNYTGLSLSGLPAGVYTVTVTDTNGCSKTERYELINPAPLSVSVSFSNVKCDKANSGYIAINPSGGTPGYNYTWNPQVTTSADSAINLGAGTYNFTVTDANGCTATGSQSITQPPLINTTPVIGTPNICYGVADGTLSFPATGGTPPLTYIASNGQNQFTSTDGFFTGLPAGNYTARITDAGGCDILVGTFNIVAATKDEFTFVVDSTSCHGNFADGKITLISVNSANSPYQYSFNSGSFGKDSVFGNLDNGEYTILVQNKNFCVDTYRVNVYEPAKITANILPEADTIFLNLGESVTLSVNVQNTEKPVYEWTPVTGLSCTDCPETTVRPITHQYYTVKVRDADNKNSECFVLASKFVYVATKTKMPNVFTPNGDNRNDKFFPVSNYAPDVSAFKIYNRWGQLVHDKPEGWDGSFEGVQQPVGVYNYYIIYYEEDASKPGQKIEVKQQGTVTLLR